MKKKFTFIIGLLLMFVFTSNVFATPKSYKIEDLPVQLASADELDVYLLQVKETIYDGGESSYHFYRWTPWGFYGIYSDDTPYQENHTIFMAHVKGSLDNVSVNGETFNIVNVSHPEKLRYDESVLSGAYYSEMVDTTTIVVAYDSDLKINYTQTTGEGLFDPFDLAITVPTKINVGDSVGDLTWGSIDILPERLFGHLQQIQMLYYDSVTGNYIEISPEGSVPEAEGYYLRIEGITIDEILSLRVNDVAFAIGKIGSTNEYNELLATQKSFAFYDSKEPLYNVVVYYNEQGELQSPEFTEPKIVDKPAKGFILNTRDELEFKIDSEYYLFDKVLVNGEVLDAKHYAVKNGSTIIILNYTYLNTLKEGEYEIEFMFANGSVKSSFEVLKSTAGTPVPKTIDYFNYYLIILIVSLVSLSLGLLYKRKHKVI